MEFLQRFLQESLQRFLRNISIYLFWHLPNNSSTSCSNDSLRNLSQDSSFKLKHTPRLLQNLPRHFFKDSSRNSKLISPTGIPPKLLLIIRPMISSGKFATIPSGLPAEYCIQYLIKYLSKNSFKSFFKVSSKISSGNPPIGSQSFLKHFLGILPRRISKNPFGSLEFFRNSFNGIAAVIHPFFWKQALEEHISGIPSRISAGIPPRIPAAIYPRISLETFQ